MENDVRLGSPLSKKLLFLIPVVVIALLLWQCAANRAEQRRINEEIATAEGFAKVVEETFRNKTELKVASINGKLEVTAVNRGTIFTTWKKTRIPYSVDYFVNLSTVDESDLRLDTKSNSLFVEIPDVIPGKPNVDEAKAIILDRGGPWTSREAGENLARRASALAQQGAQKSALDPKKLDKARSNAREAVARLLRLPLNAAGKSDVKVVIRFATEGRRSGEQWDVGPSIAEVLAQRQTNKTDGRMTQ